MRTNIARGIAEKRLIPGRGGICDFPSFQGTLKKGKGKLGRATNKPKFKIQRKARR